MDPFRLLSPYMSRNNDSICLHDFRSRLIHLIISPLVWVRNQKLNVVSRSNSIMSWTHWDVGPAPFVCLHTGAVTLKWIVQFQQRLIWENIRRKRSVSDIICSSTKHNFSMILLKGSRYSFFIYKFSLNFMKRAFIHAGVKENIIWLLLVFHRDLDWGFTFSQKF